MSKNEPRHESWIKAEEIIASHISKWYAEGRILDLSDDLIIKREKGQKPQQKMKCIKLT